MKVLYIIISHSQIWSRKNCGSGAAAIAQITFCGRTCSRCTGPGSDCPHGFPQGCAPKNNNLLRRSDVHTDAQCIRCSCLHCSSWPVPPSLKIHLVCTKDQILSRVFLLESLTINCFICIICVEILCFHYFESQLLIQKGKLP